jgi:hypothetical protein
MKTYRLILPLFATMISLGAVAQTSFDAAKLYDEELNGTARYVGMGGAMGALGSDPSVISHNPAGIGTYRNSDINTSLSVFGTSVNTDPAYTNANQGASGNIRYYSNDVKSDINLSFDNVSFIFSGSDNGNNYMNFGISYRKLQNLDRGMEYYDAFPDEDGYEVWRDYWSHQRNKVHSWDFNLSCNLNDLVYLGWTFGVLSSDTWTEGYFHDFYAAGNHPDYPDGLEYTYVDMMNTAEGGGWNMAFGMIIRPVRPLRLGVAFKTPTKFKQTLDYADFLDATMGVAKDGSKFTNSVEYKYSSPWSVNLSAGLTFGKTAIGAELEKHFTQRSSLSIGNTKMVNQGAIDYKDFTTFKVGVEQNISNIALRAGYNYVESMFNDNSYPFMYDSDFNGWGYDENNDLIFGRGDFQIDRLGKTHNYTCGIGYCSEPDRDGAQFYFDLAYVHGIRKSVFNPNEPDAPNADVDYKYTSDKVMFTIGWTF